MKHGLIALACFIAVGCAAPIVEQEQTVPMEKDFALVAIEGGF